MSQLQSALKQYFGYETFRPGQEAVIQSLLNEQDTLTILPTGTGKSLCYQLTGYLREGIVIVVSPLISLMEDQMLSLLQFGEKRVAALNSTLQMNEKQFILRHLARYKFLFLSPEMLQQDVVIQQLQQQNIALFVVDEAHCVSQWGMDFRPEYRNLKQQRAKLGNPLTLALTASAPEQVRTDILANVFTGEVTEVLHSVDRPNIALFVEQTDEKLIRLQALLRELAGGCGIIYCATRKQVEALYEALRSEHTVGFYHGGLASNQRRSLQQQFTHNQLELLIATNAFGMGINKADIDFVIHYDLPDSLENYLQEIGRAGRDGRESAAILLYQAGDERIHHFFQQNVREERESLLQQMSLSGEAGSFTELQSKWLAQVSPSDQEHFFAALEENETSKQAKLFKMMDYIETTTCRRRFLLSYFDEKVTTTLANCCDNDSAILPTFTRTFTPQNETSSWQKRLQQMFKEK